MNIVGTMCKFYPKNRKMDLSCNGLYCEVISKISEKVAKEWKLPQETYVVRFDDGLVIEANIEELEPTGQQTLRHHGTLIGRIYLYHPKDMPLNPYGAYDCQRCRAYRRDDDSYIKMWDVGEATNVVFEDGTEAVAFSGALTPVD